LQKNIESQQIHFFI